MFKVCILIILPGKHAKELARLIPESPRREWLALLQGLAALSLPEDVCKPG